MSEKDNIEKLMKSKNMQFRDFNITNIETRSEDEKSEKLIIEGTPVVFDSETVLFTMGNDAYCEVIERTALDEADMSDTIFNKNHCGRVFARTRNDSLKLNKTDDGLKMYTELWNDDEGHKELYRDIQRGLVDKMSFAFTVTDDEFKNFEADKNGVVKHLRTIKKIDKLFDVSAVDMPAYDSTSISARNVFDAESERRNSESKVAESRKRALKLKLKIRKELA